MSNTLLINIFAWSVLGGLLHACQIVIHFDVLFYGIVMHCFGPWFLWIYDECFGPWRYCFFSLWNYPVTPGRKLLSEGLGRGHKESRRNVWLEWPGSLGLWPWFGTRVWSFYGFEILQGIAEGPIVFLEDERCICIVLWCMHVGTANRCFFFCCCLSNFFCFCFV